MKLCVILKKFSMLLCLLCIFLTSVNCTNLDLQIEVTQNANLLLRSNILIRSLAPSNRPSSEANLRNQYGPKKNAMSPVEMTEESVPTKVNAWRLLNNLPEEVETTQSVPKRQTWQPVNSPQSAHRPRIQFPKEDNSQPSLHEYRPDSTRHRNNRPCTTTVPITTPYTTTSHNTLFLNELSQKFNGKLFEVVAPEFTNQNLIYSPSSLQTILSLLYYGAEGRTAAQLQNGLELPVAPADLANYIQQSLASTQMMTTDDFKFLIASKIYYKDDLILDPSFKQTALQNFYSDLERIDFASSDFAARNINQWVADKTEQRIKHIINAQTLDAQTQAILVNAIYLKAKWAKEFSQSDTDKMDYYTRNDLQHAKLVDMMYIDDRFNYGDFSALDASIVELPFLDSELSMLIIVPHRINGLKDVERRVQNENLNELLSKMEMRKVTLRIPKFKIEAELDMMEPLEKLGIDRIFTTNAELGKIFSNNPNVQISKIVHKAYINVNEGGVEAAAATFSQIVPLSLDSNMIYLTADHPFMFAIRSKQAVHFIGHVVDNFQ